jgi:hypothetical protein
MKPGYQKKFLRDFVLLVINNTIASLIIYKLAHLTTFSLSPFLTIAFGTLTSFTLALTEGLTIPWLILHATLIPGAILMIITSTLNNYFLPLFTIITIPIALIYGPTTWTRVPFYRSTNMATMMLAELTKKYNVKNLLDVGSGNGKVLITMNRLTHQSIKLSGIEISFLLWLLSYIRLLIRYNPILNKNLKFFLGSYWQISFAPYDCLYIFLSPQPMEQIWKKACQEMQPGSLIISYQFTMPSDIKPISTYSLKDSAYKLYVYKTPTV